MKLDRMKLVGGDIADISVPNVSTLPVDVSENELLGHQGGLRQGTGANWTPIPTKRIGVGPQQLIGGDDVAGFYGLVPAYELIEGSTLKTRAGVSGNTMRSLNNWMKFSIDGKIIYVAREPFINNVSWDDLNAAEAIYGNKELIIGDFTYKVRLLKGANSDPGPDVHGTTYSDKTNQSEWDRLMYRTCSYHPPYQIGSNWAEYSQLSLFVTSASGAGRATWCQERVGTSKALIRGYQRIDLIYSYSKSMRHADFGWRPVLELVQ